MTSGAVLTWRDGTPNGHLRDAMARNRPYARRRVKRPLTGRDGAESAIRPSACQTAIGGNRAAGDGHWRDGMPNAHWRDAVARDRPLTGRGATPRSIRYI